MYAAAMGKRHMIKRIPLTVEDVDSQGTCVIEFGDGITVIAECRHGDEVHLTAPAYRTAKGSEVAAGNWRLARS